MFPYFLTRIPITLSSSFSFPFWYLTSHWLSSFPLLFIFILYQFTSTHLHSLNLFSCSFHLPLNFLLVHLIWSSFLYFISCIFFLSSLNSSSLIFSTFLFTLPFHHRPCIPHLFLLLICNPPVSTHLPPSLLFYKHVATDNSFIVSPYALLRLLHFPQIYLFSHPRPREL